MGVKIWTTIISNFTPCLQIRYMNGCQAGATIENIFPYARHAARNRNGGQSAATVESSIPYACHAIFNYDFYNFRAIIKPSRPPICVIAHVSISQYSQSMCGLIVGVCYVIATCATVICTCHHWQQYHHE